jgi:hypothetical protein
LCLLRICKTSPPPPPPPRPMAPSLAPPPTQASNPKMEQILRAVVDALKRE